ncbi:MAG: TonB-dependent receptor domain-containing protein [Pyrinomonadaceae bacterium]
MLRSKFNSTNLLIALLVIFISAVAGHAQFRGGIQGTVIDAAGGTVAGATVTLTSKETNQIQTTTTSDGGFYRFAGLAPGLYSVAVEQQGFKKRVVDDVKVDAESVRGQDVALETGAISETVTVNAEAEGPVLQTEDANIRKTISTDEVLRLPQAGRDPYELARLAPGVFGAGARSAGGDSVRLPNTSGPGGSNNSIFQTENAQPISANGQRVSANNYQIDGTSVNSQTWGGAAVITPSQESVKEVQVTSSTYSAEDGRNSGAQIRVVSQNGTNDWHGSAFYKIADPKFNAFNKFHGVPGVVTAVPTRVERKYKTYGGSFGGPVHFLNFGEGVPAHWSGKDKLFFFFSYEGVKENTSNTYNAVIDTASFRQGIIAARPNTVTSRVLSSAGVEPRVVQILSATCATAGINGPCQAVGNGFDVGSITGTYGTYVPLGQQSGGGLDGIADLQYAQLSNPRTFTGNQYFTRIDYEATKRDKLTVSSYIVPTRAFNSDTGAQSRPMADINSTRLSYALGFIYSRTISSTLINEARFNITRWGFDETKSNPNANYGLPRIEIESVTNDRLRWGAPRAENTPGIITEQQYDFRDNLTKIWGNQVLKFGAEYRKDLNSNGEPGGARPFYIFNRLWNFANGTPIFEVITADQNGKPSANNTKFTTSELAFFVQDDWKFRPNLTLNLGLRWSYYSPIRASDGILGNLIPDANGGLAGAKISTDKTFYDKDLNNFGPQIGFAWSPNWLGENRLVVRGGGGIGYDRLPNALLANARRNPPNGFKFEICCGTAATDFGSPFAGGRITYVASTDGTIFGYPANPVLGGGRNPANGLPNSGSIEIYAAPRHLPTAYVYRYSLEAQYQLPTNMIGTLGYQGSVGHKFVRILPLQITGPSTNPAIFAAYYASPDVNMNYNAMIARLQGRFVRQLQFDVNYRFSKSIDTVSFEGPTGLTNQSFPVDQREERGPSDYDVKHFITASVLWDLPIFTNRSSWTGKLLGGWQINAIATHHTGFPWTPKLFGCPLGTTTARFCDPRPTRYFGGQPLSNTNENFLKPGGIFPGGGAAYFSTSIPENGSPFVIRPGIGRNVFRGPKYSDLDMSFIKEFGLPSLGVLGENAKLDLRFNFFNILNTLNLAPFNSNTDPTRVQLIQFGTATGALAGRTGEFQVRFSF